MLYYFDDNYIVLALPDSPLSGALESLENMVGLMILSVWLSVGASLSLSPGVLWATVRSVRSLMAGPTDTLTLTQR